MSSHTIYFIKDVPDIDLEREFFKFPKSLIKIFLDTCRISSDNNVKCYLDNEPQAKTLKYDENGRLYIGNKTLKNWFSADIIEHRRFIKVERLVNNYLKLTPLVESDKVENSIKGEIGELGIFQLIYSSGMGYIHCYRPIKDMEGIDVILNMQYKRNPIYLQVKCGFDPNGQLWFDVPPEVTSFTPSNNFFIICMLYDLKELDFYDYLYVIPSKDLYRIAKIKNKMYQIRSNIKNPSDLSEYRIKRTELVAFLFEKFRKLEFKSR